MLMGVSNFDDDYDALFQWMVVVHCCGGCGCCSGRKWALSLNLKMARIRAPQKSQVSGVYWRFCVVSDKWCQCRSPKTDMPFKAISGDGWDLFLTAPTARAVLHINVHLGKLGVGHEEWQWWWLWPTWIDDFGTKLSLSARLLPFLVEDCPLPEMPMEKIEAEWPLLDDPWKWTLSHLGTLIAMKWCDERWLEIFGIGIGMFPEET